MEEDSPMPPLSTQMTRAMAGKRGGKGGGKKLVGNEAGKI